MGSSEQGLQRNALFLYTGALVLIGALLLYSASKGVLNRFEGGFLKQIAWICLGTVCLVVARRIDYWSYRKLAGVLYILMVVLLLLVLAIGQGRASRWIRIGWFSFQPSEFSKLVLVISLAGFLSNRDVRRPGVFIGSLLLTVVPCLMILKQPNLGTAFILLLIYLGMVFCAGMTRKQFFGMVVAGIIMSPILWFAMEPYQRDRVLTFLNPSRDPLGSGYNLLQSKITIGSGGIIGKGFLKGTQTKLAFLPEYHTDFIFCLLAEEFGFIGVLVFCAIYYAFLSSILRIATTTQDRFAEMVAVGILVMFFSQFAINVGMAVGLFPVAGIPLPFISYGGSSLVVSMTAVGMLANIRDNAALF